MPSKVSKQVARVQLSIFLSFHFVTSKMSSTANTRCLSGSI